MPSVVWARASLFTVLSAHAGGTLAWTPSWTTALTADGTVCPSDPAGCTDGSVYFGGCVSGAVPVAVPPTSRTDDPPPTPTLTAPSSIGSCSPLRLGEI